MSFIITDNQNYIDIANAIREKNGSAEDYKPKEMANAITNLPTPGKVEPLEVTANGTYTPPEGVDGYAPVTVAVYDTELPKITDASYLFYDGARLDEVDKFITLISEDCTNFEYMFSFDHINNSGVLRTVPQFNTSNGTNFGRLYKNAKYLTAVPTLDTSNGKFFYEMFYHCESLKTIPQMDTSKCTSFLNMFYRCSGLETIPQIDTSNGTEFGHMFRYCARLTTVPPLDLTKGTNYSYMFNGCEKLTTAPLVTGSNVVALEYMFGDCSELTAAPTLDTSNSKNLKYAFKGCSKLTTIPLLDLNLAEEVVHLVLGCKALTNLTLLNIRINLQIGSGTSYGHLLTVDSLVNTIKELCTVTTTQTLTMGSVNLEKISGLYCKITDDTNEKLTMELCESTDEGAMTLADYASLKGWLLK